MLQDLFTRRVSRPQHADSSDILYQLVDVQQKYGKVHALSNIHLSINKGEVVFVTGPSGAGKTTLLRLIAGEINPSKGKVLQSRKSPVFSSQVFQDLRLIEELSGEENLRMVYDPSIYMNHREFLNDMEEMCSVFGVGDRVDRKVRDMNGGLKQKIAIIRSLLTKPDVFIADEPTSSLDLDNARRLFDVLSLFNVKRGLTVIWATHNRELVKRFNGRIIHLDKGKIINMGHACFI